MFWCPTVQPGRTGSRRSEGTQFAGPSAIVELDLGGADAQLDAGYLMRLDDAPQGEGLRNVLQASAGMRFPLCTAQGLAFGASRHAIESGCECPPHEHG